MYFFSVIWLQIVESFLKIYLKILNLYVYIFNVICQ
jgi:hypothetical protein